MSDHVKVWIAAGVGALVMFAVIAANSHWMIVKLPF